MKKDVKILFEEFLVFEEENNLVDWQIDGIPIWQLIRIKVSGEIEKRLFTDVTPNSDRKTATILKGFISFLKYSISKNPIYYRGNVDFLVFNHPRRKLSKGSYEDIYTDPFLDEINGDSMVIERYLNLNHLTPARTKKMYYLDYIEFPSRFADFFFFEIFLSNKNSLKIIEIENKIFDKWGVKIFNLKKEITSTLKRYNYLSPRIDKMIDKLNPKVILVVVSYTIYAQIVILIAKKRKIPVCELQHGIAGKLHIAYNYLTKKEVLTFPDYFLAWGTYWIKNTRMPIPENRKMILGFPYIERYSKTVKNKVNPKQILILSQMRDDLARFTYELAKILPDFEFIFKAHPGEYSIAKTQYAFLLSSSNIKIIADDEMELYSLISECKFVVGINSTAIIEALAFKAVILIVKLPGWEYYENIEPTKELIFVSTINEAKEFITNSALRSIDLNDSNQYFRKNSISNISDFLNSLLSRFENNKSS